MADHPTYVIVGASLAGAKAAEGLREGGFEGRVVLVGDERDRPYERPPLSKGLLTGKQGRDKTYVHEEGWYADHDVELVLGATVTGLHRKDRQVELAGGERIDYQRVLLATGSSPRRLEVAGADLEGLRYLRRVAEAESLREALVGGGPVAVVGGGWIGLEVASAARYHGAPVTVIEPQPTPLYAVLGREVGEIFARLHRSNGVDVRTDTGVTGFVGEAGQVSGVVTSTGDVVEAETVVVGGAGRVSGVVTSTGDVVEAETVVVGVGIVPNVRLAEAAGLEVDNGVLVDELLRTSDPDVFAAGDVANALNPLLGARLRVEHWANAANQGKAAGLSMADAGEPYAKLPYFFTDQHSLSMEYHGWVGPDGYDEVVLRGDPESGEWLAFWLLGGRVLAGMNVNVWDQSDGIKRLARERAMVDRDRLADPAVPLDTL